MDSNTEASLLMEGPARAPEFVALRRFIHDAWRKAEGSLLTCFVKRIARTMTRGARNARP
jgi:hypothetical protein